MLTHVQTLLSRLYKIACTMIQYVLRIVLRKCLFYALYVFSLVIRVFEMPVLPSHRLLKSHLMYMMQ